MAKKMLPALSEIANIDRKALAQYRELEKKNSQDIITSFFGNPMAAIEQIIELRMSLTPEQFRADLWTERYGSSEFDRKIAAIAYPYRIWELEVAKMMLPDVLAANQSLLEGADPQPLIHKLANRRVELMLCFFTSYRHAMQGEESAEKALHFLCASVYRRLRRNAPNGAPIRYARSLEHDHPKQTFKQALEEELPGAVAILRAEKGLGPAAIAALHTACAKSVQLLEPERVILSTNLPKEQSLEVIVDGKLDPLQSILAAEERAWGEEQLAALPEKARLTMRLWLEDHTYAEIAAIRGVGLETVKEQLKGASAKLRTAGKNAS